MKPHLNYPGADEVQSDRGLQLYGIALCITLVITGFFWFQSTLVANIQTGLEIPLCWPYNSLCETTHEWAFENFHWLNALMALTSIVAASAFYFRRVSWGMWGLTISVLLKFFMFSQDYRLMGNYHYMSFLVILFFLVIPGRVQALQFLIPIFYISAGFLKLHPEWLSGANLLTKSWIPQYLLWPALAGVLPLELFIAPLLIFVRKGTKLWWFCFLSLVLFHIISWHLVGYFYPMIMFCLLSYYLLCTPVPAQWPGRAALVALLLVALPQLARTFLPGTGLEGKARLLSLNMLDTMPLCQSHFVLKSDHQTVLHSLDTDLVAPRIRCDPILFISELNRICSMNATESPYEVDLIVEVKSAVSTQFTTMIDLRDACGKNVSINWLGEVTQ